MAQPFQSLDQVGSRARSFWTSVVMHGVMLSMLLAIPLIFTDALKIKYDVTVLTPPPPHQQPLEVTYWKETPKPTPEPRPEKVVAPPPRKPLLADVKPPVIQRMEPEPIVINLPRVDPPRLPPEPVLSPGSSAKPTVNLPAREVQTGGFGDANGVRAEGRPDKPVNIASLGSFDLPTGDGAGNGTGGAHGVRGTVASAGFGNAVAPVGGGGNSGRSVRSGSFGDVEPGQPAAGPKKRDLGPPQTPAEILFKPRPEYTEEARKLKLEGEILLRVVFTSAGEVRVLDVVRGLGHGLEESAIRAARQIRFKPALRDGQPVDSAATVHIVFQLAY